LKRLILNTIYEEKKELMRGSITGKRGNGGKQV
jgi:hypothetical protein